MFTGIIEEVGTVEAVRGIGDGLEIVIRAAHAVDGLALGDSVAVDGVCLTVVALAPGGFTVQAIASTLGRTTLRGFDAGRRVNLERALAFGQRLGGHLVQGHVDGVGVVRAVTRRAEMVLIDFSLPPTVAPVTVLHGSITLDGVSLTINELGDDAAQVAIVPFTWEHTNLARLTAGARVNLEADLIGKFVQRLAAPYVGVENSPATSED